MSPARVVWMVARREIRTRILTKANIISMAVMVVLILVGAVVGNYVIDRGRDAPAARVGLSESVADLEPALEQAAAKQDVELALEPMTADDARAALTAEDRPLVAFLDGDPASPRMLVAEEADEDVLGAVTAAVQSYTVEQQISALSGDPETFAAALARAAPQVEPLRGSDADDGLDGVALGIATLMISLLFGALIGAGSMIAMGVVEEKTSRVVEILLATIKPTQLLAGKILGIGTYGLLQLGVLGGALLVASRVLGMGDLELDVGAALLWLILWFLVGYALYALLFGGFAALVSRQEDIGSVTTPLLFLMFVPFYGTMFLVPDDPDSTLVRVLSQVPFFAPFMMPVRNAFGALEPWEMPLSLAIAAVTIPVLVVLAARVYKRGVLHTGGRMKLKEALGR